MHDRTKYIGGSDIAAVCGLSKYRTPYQVWLEKIGRGEEVQDNKYMYWGRKLESTVISEFEEKTGLQVSKKQDFVVNSRCQFLASTIDGFVESENAVVEAKTSSRGDGFGEDGTDEMPREYIFQCAHNCNNKGADKVYMPVLIGGNDFRTYIYKRNETLQNKIQDKAIAFWEKHVIPQIPPEVTTLDDVKNLYSLAIPDKTIVAENDIESLYYEILQMERNKAAIEENVDRLKVKILDYMKDSELLLSNDGTKLCSAKNVEMQTFDSKKFKEKSPDLYHQFLRMKTYRRFLIHKPKEE